MMTTVIDANKSDVSILVLNEKSWNEFWAVRLPHTLSEQARKRAENKLTSSGFREEYEFAREIVDKRSITLAKAQAASVLKRIFAKTGVKMELSHGIHIKG